MQTPELRVGVGELDDQRLVGGELPPPEGRDRQLRVGPLEIGQEAILRIGGQGDRLLDPVPNRALPDPFADHVELRRDAAPAQLRTRCRLSVEAVNAQMGPRGGEPVVEELPDDEPTRPAAERPPVRVTRRAAEEDLEVAVGVGVQLVAQDGARG